MFNRTGPVKEFHDVRLGIITLDGETRDFIVYTTVVTAAFLKRFAEPMKAAPNSQDQSGMRIEFTRVPVWPVLGLRERLGKALGRELVGDVQEAIDLFSDDAKGDDNANGKAGNDKNKADRYKEAQRVAAEQQHQTQRCKRKRTDDVSRTGIQSRKQRRQYERQC